VPVDEINVAPTIRTVRPITLINFTTDILSIHFTRSSL